MTVSYLGVDQLALLYDPDPTNISKPLWLIIPDQDSNAETVLQSSGFRSGANANPRLLAVLYPAQDPLEAPKLAEITLSALLRKQKSELSRVYVIGIGSGADTALAFTLSRYTKPAGIAVIGQVSGDPPETLERGTTTAFLVGELAANSDEMSLAATGWAAAMRCGTVVSGTVEGIRQRGHYGCKDGATVLFGTVTGFDDIGPTSRLNLSFLIESYFNAYAR